ncbi:MAG: heavy-metal-associated domain-containing protein [Gluconacetobacter diazotrophicus]|nr:heavy-metal-associated domain-containing protein [Gluconacetobacter diazotrophicus]
MKRSILRRVWLAAALAILLLPGARLAADEPKGTVVKSVLKLEPEIDCPSCEDGIKHTLVTAHGVQDAEVDVLNNKVIVRYDPARIKLQALIGRIGVIGYKATEVK